MESHGNYKIELISNVVHIYPSGGFNEQGVQQLNEEIVKIAPLKIAWALLAHPQDSAGLTPEAVNEIVKFFNYISTLNCVAVGIEVSSTWQGILEKSIVGNVNIPVYMNNDLLSFEHLIKQKLDSAK